MRRLRIVLLPWLFAACLAAGPAAAGEGGTEQRGTFAKPLERSPPRFPGSQLDRGKQGWVQLSFVVTEQGKVIDPVISDSSGIRGFEQAALRAVRDWSYEPATWDGDAVQQCQNEVMITFAIEEREGIGRRFYSKYRKVDKALAANELDKARKLLDDAAEEALSVWDYAAYQFLEARYADAVDDPKARLRHLRHAGMSDGNWVSDDMYASILYASLITEIELEKYSNALATWDKLQEANEGRYELAELENGIARLREFVAGPSVIAVDAALERPGDCEECAADWHYKPLRRSFSIGDVRGEIDKLEIRCDWNRYVDNDFADKRWSIPEEWGDCRVIVEGAPGTRFAYLEQPAT